jgi:homoserine kinase
MKPDSVKIIAPASIANVGPGFDVFGLALAEPYDVIAAWRVSEPGVVIDHLDGLGARRVTPDPNRNTAAVAARSVLDLAKADFGIRLRITKGIRPCSGMGSSGASAAGGAYAANLLLDDPMPVDRLIPCAAKGEEASSGSFHADNVSPALLGGFTLIRSYDPLDVIRISPPRNLGIVAALPDIMVPTKEARAVLPRQVELKSLVFQVGHASALAAGMAQGDMDLIGRSIKDIVIEPARAALVPHLAEAEAAARSSGAIAAFLGGSGPCVACFFDLNRTDGAGIAEAVSGQFGKHGVECATWVTTWGTGCRRE